MIVLELPAMYESKIPGSAYKLRLRTAGHPPVGHKQVLSAPGAGARAFNDKGMSYEQRKQERDGAGYA